jgi:hypothetical protein
MFSVAYVVLPFSSCNPADAIANSLARFERSSRGDIPEDWLQFHDETSRIREAHRAQYIFTRTPNGLQTEGGDTWDLSMEAISSEMDRRGLERWRVCFSQVEPDLGRFADRFARELDRHPVTGGFGRWLNPLGRWDWWDVGGRFDGRICGGQKPGRQNISAISSGHNTGRVVLENLKNALARDLGQDPTYELDLQTRDNAELVSKLLIDVRADRPHAFPGVVVLPPGLCDDSERWLASPPAAVPVGARSLLKLADKADWRQAVEATYGCFQDHWAAGVAFHY